MAIVFSDNFDSYSDGDLNGQGSWSGSTTMDVQGTTVKAGAKAIQSLNNGNGQVITRAFTATGGTPVLSVYVRNNTASAQGAYSGISDSAGEGWYCVMKSDNTWYLTNPSAFSTTVAVGSGWSPNTWYKVEIEVDTANKKARARIDGGTWSSYVTNSSFGTQVSKVQLTIGANFSGISYWDSLNVFDSVSSIKTAKVLVVAGGGGGGSGGGGGGAGGYQYDAVYNVDIGSYSITIGGGGTGSNGTLEATQGSNSAFDSSGSPFTSIGGGGGVSNFSNSNPNRNGGSGGGSDSSGGADTPGTGVAGQGYGGGANSVSSPYPSGGGGGASAAGAAGSGSASGNGGAGTANSITGASVTYAGGGGGGSRGGISGTPGSGGAGGGGGGTNGTSTATAGTANTGGGGGGGGYNGTAGSGGNGGSGVIIVAYTTSDFSHTGGDATGTNGSETWVEFTSGGTLVLAAPSTTYNQSAAAAGAASAATIKQIPRTYAAAGASTATMKKSLTMGITALHAAGAGVATALKALTLSRTSLAATAAGTAAVSASRAFIQALAATGGAAADVATAMIWGLALSASSAGTSTLSKTAALYRTLVATAAGAAVTVVTRGIMLHAIGVGAATISNAVGKALNVIAAANARIRKDFWKNKYTAQGDDYDIKYPHGE